MDFTEGAFGATVHFLAFFLLGVSIAAAHEPWLQRRRFAWLGVVVLIACTVLELVQLLQPTRHPRVTDLALNVLGLLVGLWSSTRWRTGRDWRLAVQEYFERRPLLLETGVLVLAIMWWWSAGLQPALGSPRMEWSKDFPLIIGNELDGSRPWFGEIRYAGVYGRALTGEQVIELLNALEKGEERNATEEMGLLAGYDFRRGRTDVIAPEGKLQSRDLLIEVPGECAWVANGGIELRKPARLVTRGPAADLTEAILAEAVNPRNPEYYFPLGTTATGSAALAALLAIIIGLPAFSLFRLCGKGWGTHFCAIGLTLCMGSAPYVIASLSAGGPSWRWNSLTWLSGALLVVYPLALFHTTSPQSRSVRGSSIRRP